MVENAESHAAIRRRMVAGRTAGAEGTCDFSADDTIHRLKHGTARFAGNIVTILAHGGVAGAQAVGETFRIMENDVVIPMRMNQHDFRYGSETAGHAHDFL